MIPLVSLDLSMYAHLHARGIIVKKKRIMCVCFIRRVHRSRQEEYVQSKSIALEGTGTTPWRCKEAQLNFH